MDISRGTRWFLRGAMAIVLAFLYAPLLVVAIYAFNSRVVQVWPPPSLSLRWFSKALDNAGMRDALWTSVKAGVAATAIALVSLER